LRKTQAEKSHDYCDAIVFKNIRFQYVFGPRENEKPAFSNSSGLKSVFEKFLFRDGLVWTVGLTELRNKAPFSNFSGVVCTGPEKKTM